MVLVTKLTRALGIRHPIVQGGMHHVGLAPLAAAVSNAGGLGMVTALTQPTPADLRREIQKTRELTNKPFGVNFTIIPSFKQFDFDGFAQAIIDEKIPVIETAGSPLCAKYWEMFKRANKDVTIIHKCVSIRHALKAQDGGCDFISLDGFECAGHPGEEDIGNFVLQALGAKKLRIPFLCSGGVSDGTQLAAALALGADGVNCGTRFMATAEAPIRDEIKQALVAADERDTALVMRSVRNTERVYKNDVVRQVVEIEAKHPGDFSKIAHLMKGDNYRRSFHETGNTQDSVWSAGIVMGLIDDIPTCQELLDRMVRDAEAIITQRLAGMVRAADEADEPQAAAGL